MQIKVGPGGSSCECVVAQHLYVVAAAVQACSCFWFGAGLGEVVLLLLPGAAGFSGCEEVLAGQSVVTSEEAAGEAQRRAAVRARYGGHLIDMGGPAAPAT
jgi:hypothetical protein